MVEARNLKWRTTARRASRPYRPQHQSSSKFQHLIGTSSNSALTKSLDAIHRIPDQVAIMITNMTSWAYPALERHVLRCRSHAFFLPFSAFSLLFILLIIVFRRNRPTHLFSVAPVLVDCGFIQSCSGLILCHTVQCNKSRLRRVDSLGRNTQMFRRIIYTTSRTISVPDQWLWD